ncbi:MAG TPA: type II toxin-antitoxin system HicB family antitoxin [Thermoanaerobaculia bacterium]
MESRKDVSVPIHRHSRARRRQGFHAFVPALRGCHTQGSTEEETLANAREAISAYIESLKAHGEPVPAENLLIRPVEVGA